MQSFIRAIFKRKKYRDLTLRHPVLKALYVVALKACLTAHNVGSYWFLLTYAINDYTTARF